ncbi:MAG: phosphatase PAP2 family protein [Chloroflexi bacterium]|nr:phosphatase PAP2 family protein [Chloroflexota bacterium]
MAGPEAETEGAGLWRRLARPFSKRDLLEGLLVGVAFLLYFGVRGAAIDRPETAFANALDVIGLQRRLGFFWEADMQEWTLNHLFLVQAANIVYFWLHLPLIGAFAFALYYWQRHKYTLIRDAFLATGAIALVVYWSYPVAPPRELPKLAVQFSQTLPPDVAGFKDTVQDLLGYAYQSSSTRAFVNPYAAMPSLHFGWDLLLGIGIVWAFWGRRWMWLAVPIGVALPVMQVFAVAITANHFFLDVIAGAAASLMGIPVALAVNRWVYPRLRKIVERLPWPRVRRWILPQERAKATEA